MDIVNEKNKDLRKYLKEELQEICDHIYSLCDHKFIRDDFEIKMNEMKSVYYCLYCDEEKR